MKASRRLQFDPVDYSDAQLLNSLADALGWSGLAVADGELVGCPPGAMVAIPARVPHWHENAAAMTFLEERLDQLGIWTLYIAGLRKLTGSAIPATVPTRCRAEAALAALLAQPSVTVSF